MTIAVARLRKAFWKFLPSLFHLSKANSAKLKNFIYIYFWCFVTHFPRLHNKQHSAVFSVQDRWNVGFCLSDRCREKACMLSPQDFAGLDLVTITIRQDMYEAMQLRFIQLGANGHYSDYN